MPVSRVAAYAEVCCNQGLPAQLPPDSPQGNLNRAVSRESPAPDFILNTGHAEEEERLNPEVHGPLYEVDQVPRVRWVALVAL
ncbi:hypothetical protein D1872_281940 [compost metagenome]